ncbi:hypothetical protein R3P38DRAFT_3229696 [Favolaschia claudopus]|uniref:Uncharacterized protein n=1 Tax=Favolaschia claudopus TaxID=2862362 RepID=A0AAV9ZNQ0_9AGAR
MVGGGIRMKKESGRWYIHSPWGAASARIRAHRSPADRAMMVRAEGAVRPSETGRLFALISITGRHPSIRPATAPPPFLQLPLAFHTTAPATAAHRPSNTSRLYAASLSGLSSPSVPPQICLLPPVPNQRWLAPALPALRSHAASPQSSYLLLGLALSGLRLSETSSFRH